tara:strand:- start:9158 stop:11791 length:2634 start_codon:yes stop_codon:yes gene_type:complete
MNVPTPHVIVAFDKPVMQALFNSGARLEDLIENISASGALLFDAKSNPNFIDFEHSFGGKEEGNVMKLTLVDPKKEFEKRFLIENSESNLYNYVSRKKESKADPITAIRQRNDIDNLRKSNLIENYKLDFAKNYEESIAPGAKRFYVSYGVGSNLDAWSGPHTMILMGAEIAIEGPRQITLSFAATPLSFSSEGRRDINQRSVHLNLEGLGMEIDARSFPINFSNDDGIFYPEWAKTMDFTKFGDSSVESFEQDYETFLDKAELNLVHDFIEQIDLHLLLTDVIRDLIIKATGNTNVIVVLPNLNYTLSYTLQQFLKEQYLEIQAPKSTKALTASPGSVLNFFATILARQVSNYRYSKIGKLFYVFNAILNKFGMTFNSHAKLAQNVPGLFRALQNYIRQDEASSFNDRVEKFIDKNYFTAGISHRTDEGLIDYWSILRKIIRGLKGGSKGVYSSNLQIFYESDTKLLDFWGNDLLKTHPIFSGPNIDFDKDGDGAIIFGDIQLIHNFLYGGMEHEKLDYTRVKTQDHYEKLARSFEMGYDWTTDTIDGIHQDKHIKLQEEANMSLLNLTPFHPIDKILLGGAAYSEEVRAITYPPHPIAGPYGNISYIPEDFQHTENFSKDKREAIHSAGIPVFRYNTKNPNITKLKLDNNLIYLKNLYAGYRRDISRRASSTVKGMLENKYASFNFPDRDSIMGFIKQRDLAYGNDPIKRFKILKELAGKIESGLLAQTIVSTYDTPHATASLLLETYLNLDKNSGNMVNFVFDQYLPGDPITALAEFSEAMHRDTFSLNITTLPSFHFGTGRMLMSECVVLAQDAPILQTEVPKSDLLNSFMSGWYNITSFKHTISSRGAESEFSLVRNSKSISPTEKETEQEV